MHDLPRHADGTHAVVLGELEATLRALSAVSEDSALYVAGQALDLASALLDRHAHRGTP